MNEELDIIKDGRRYVYVKNLEDFKNMKSNSSYYFDCAKCGTRQFVNHYYPNKFDRISRMLCWSCGHKASSLKNYGVDNPSKAPEIKQKKIETCRANFGTDHPSQSEIVQRKCLETSRKNWGTNHPSQSDKVKERAKQTNLLTRGVEWAAQDPEVIEKIKQTNIEKYGEDSYMKTKEFQERSRQICLERYGELWAIQSDEVKRKRSEKNLEKYGEENPHSYGSKSFAEDMVAKYGEVYPYAFGSENFYNLMEERYGCKTALQNTDIYQQFRQTLFNKYGMYHFPTGRYYCDGQHFDSKYELYYWMFNRLIGKPIVRDPFRGTSGIFYKYKGIVHSYYPDFMVEDKLIEIKGTQFFENGDPTQKMINVYDRSQDGLFEAKHQCMISNDVIILTNKSPEFKHIVEYVDNYLKQYGLTIEVYNTFTRSTLSNYFIPMNFFINAITPFNTCVNGINSVDTAKYKDFSYKINRANAVSPYDMNPM